MAKELFGLYGLNTSTDFIDNNTIGIVPENGDPQNSSVRYLRITED